MQMNGAQRKAIQRAAVKAAFAVHEDPCDVGYSLLHLSIVMAITYRRPGLTKLDYRDGFLGMVSDLIDHIWDDPDIQRAHEKLTKETS